MSDYALKLSQSRTIVEYITDDYLRHANTSVITVNGGASLAYFLVVLGGAKIEKELTVKLSGEGACADLKVIVLGLGESRLNLRSVTLHNAPRTQGRITVRTVLRDLSEINYQGLIKIKKNAQQTNSFLASHTVLLGKECRANTVPALEIEANDVKCSHEATVAPINSEQIFYLTSRGIGQNEAENLIAKGFLLSSLEYLPEIPIKKQLLEKIGDNDEEN